MRTEKYEAVEVPAETTGMQAQPMSEKPAQKNLRQSLTAFKAKEIAEGAMKDCVQYALTHIEQRAKDGFTEALMFHKNLNMDGVHELIRLGYSISQIMDQNGLRVYKISW